MQHSTSPSMTARVEKLSKLKPPQAELALGVGYTYLDDLGENWLAAVPFFIVGDGENVRENGACTNHKKESILRDWRSRVHFGSRNV